MRLFEQAETAMLWCPNAKRMYEHIIKPAQRPKCTCLACPPDLKPEFILMSQDLWDDLVAMDADTKKGGE
jgi:hypothetical protein